jgi:hypothetical protein
MKRITPERTYAGWYVVDHARNNAVLRGPYEHAETAGDVRAEIESTLYDPDEPDEDQYQIHPNLWVVECKDEQEYRQMTGQIFQGSK